ncbi:MULTISPECIES: hypothetical protein [unclassified Streptomyces]|uniref:hypothetical protein n=1 Tax=unclassified Streptomyces TaxID=2593676 RepID=UPI00278BC5BF|nr:MULTISPECIES: hypothetical protein [unclassified Streptomyces]
MNATVPEVPFTDLLRSPADTAEKLRTVRAVRLRRRDADDLFLMRADRMSGEAEVVDFTATLLTTMLTDGEGGTAAIRRALPRVLPWLRFLPDGSAEEMLGELTEVATASRDLDTVTPIAQVLTEWRHSAEIYADPDLLVELTRERGGDAGPVPCPVAPEPAEADER